MNSLAPYWLQILSKKDKKAGNKHEAVQSPVLAVLPWL